MRPFNRRSQLLLARRELGVGGLGATADVMADFQSGARSLAAASIRSVTLRSNLSPDVRMASPLEAAGPAGGGVRRRGGFSEALLAIMKPAVEIETVAGRLKIEPWGPPTMNLFWPIVILGAAGAAALAIVVGKNLRS